MAEKVSRKKDLEMPLEMFSHMLGYLTQAQGKKEEGKPVVWSSLLIPKEIYNAMGVNVVYTELYGLAMSAMQLSGHYCGVAEERGFSRDVCAVHRCFIGCSGAEAEDKDEEDFLDTLFAAPDLILATNLPCMSESKSLLFSAERHKCPYLLIDTPLNTWGIADIPEYAIQYYVNQLKEAIHMMEELGYKFDMEKMKEAVELSRRLELIWKEIDELRTAVPCPIGPVDAFWSAIASWCLEPKEAIEIFGRLRDELKERVDNGVGELDDEKLRLFFMGVPTVYNMELLNYVNKYGAIFAKNWIESLLIGYFDLKYMDPEKPLESLARRTISSFVNPTFENYIDSQVEMAKKFHSDGVVYFVKRSCGIIPGMARPYKDAFFDRLGIPTSIFDLDGIDTREQDDANAKMNLDSFVEVLQESKRRVI